MPASCPRLDGDVGGDGRVVGWASFQP